MGIIQIGARDTVQATSLATQFKSGDRSAGDELAGHVRGLLRKRFSTLGVQNQDLEDLVQECTALVFEGIQSFDPAKGNLDSWLSGYARNVARSWWRGAYSRRNNESPMETAVESSVAPEVDLNGSGALEAALGELNPIDQELLQMRFGFGHSFEEIAEMAHITPVNARKRVSRAVETLRRCPALRAELGFSV